jgi:predicted acyltransferase
MSSNPVTRTLKTHFTHVQWEGLHFYDLIYPLFLFLVGVSIVFSLDKAIPTERLSAIIGRILRRGLLLWVLGFIYNGGFTARWPDLRMGGAPKWGSAQACLSGGVQPGKGCCGRGIAL